MNYIIIKKLYEEAKMFNGLIRETAKLKFSQYRLRVLAKCQPQQVTHGDLTGYV